MNAETGTRLASVVLCCLSLFVPASAVGEIHTGRLAGTVSEEQGAAIGGAEITATNVATGEERRATSADSGSYVMDSLARGIYRVRVTAGARVPSTYETVRIHAGRTTSLNPLLRYSPAQFGATVYDSQPVLPPDADKPTLSTAVDAKTIEAMPLPTRNFLQLTTLAPGVSAPLTENNSIGRNSPNINVNGARNSQNNLQINGVDANEIQAHDFSGVAVPAPESIHEMIVETSMPDITVGGGGAVVQISTRSGGNKYHGEVYEYLRNDALNANDPNLKAAGLARPELSRNVYGATLGGPLRKDRIFFFVSYQGTREANAATGQSIYKSVLIAPGLNDDRSEATLLNTFHPVLANGTHADSIDPVALKVLNARLPSGQFLIPTPQADGRVTGSVLSTYHEEQFNANVDFRLGPRDTLSPKFFFANAPQFNGLGPGTLPGFASHITNSNHLLAIREVHSFSSRTINEVRFGYNFIREHELTDEPFNDSDFGITRSTAGEYPGLPLISLGNQDGAGSIGTPNVTIQTTSASFSVIDVLSLERHKHHLRLGGEFHSYRWSGGANINNYGTIDFAHFNDFLVGNSDLSSVGIGIIKNRDFRSSDYAAFVQDDWKLSPRLVINLGLRYELDLPPYETHGLIGGFDPSLYRPNMQVDANGLPVGPPAAGFFVAENAPPQFSLPGVARVGKRLLKSVDPLNFGPRIGFAWSPSDSGRAVIRGGYGVFYSRPSFFYLGLDTINLPFFTFATFSGATLSNPFPGAPPESAFSGIPAGLFLADGAVADRNNRTPYVKQFNASVQYELWRDTTLQVAYVGTRGSRLFRRVTVNQARIASTLHPIQNVVTGSVVTDNTPGNAPLRAPLQGVDPGLFDLNQTTATSSYNALQVTIQRKLSHRLQFQAAYTYSRSVDNASNPGGGAFTDGTIDRGTGVDTSSPGSLSGGRALSDFDRTHYFSGYFIWSPAPPAFVGKPSVRHLLSNWEFSGIVTVMSGLPIDIFDPGGGSLYGLLGARPNWAPGADRRAALTNIPPGYYFNPGAFAQAIVQPGQPIPSAHDPTALVGGTDPGTDIGNVGRNVLRGPAQSNVDFSILRRFTIREAKTLELRADIFNVLNHANRDNPISNIGTVTATGGSIDPTTGQILSPGDFGRIVSFSSSPRIVQLALKFKF